MPKKPPHPALCADTLRGPAPATEPQDPRAQHDELVNLAAIAAHQLKSPLHSIQTTLNLLIGGFVGPITPNQRALLENATRSATRGSDLVSDLLRLRGLDVLSADDLIPVSVIEALRTAMERVRDIAEGDHVDLAERQDLDDPGRGWALAEPGVVQELLFVLLDNAVKYTPAGGRVTVRLFAPDPPLELPESPSGGRARSADQIACEVVDTGIGVPPSAWPKLFGEFFRAPNARGLSRDGTGLGLAFAARAVALLGGRLRLEPAPGGGVRALLVLPATAATTHTRPAEGGPPISQRVVVIGGVSAGSKAAARIARLDPDAEVIVVERGQFLSYAGCGLPYYISGAVRDQRALLSSALGEMRDSSFFHSLKNVRALDQTEALGIDRENRQVRVRRATDGRESVLPYDHLVLATGARAAIPPLPGVNLKGVYTLHGVEDAEAIRAELRDPRAREVVIVGGGLLGSQITEAVALRGARLSLVEAQAAILGIVDPELALHVERHMERRGVRVFTGCAVEALEGHERVSSIRLADGRRLPCDFAILATGVRPEVTLAGQAGLTLGVTGAIQTDPSHRTSDPRIFAVGDCAESLHLLTGKPTWIPLGSTATKHGRVAANAICGREDHSLGVVGSMVLKVFDWTAGCTGLSEAEARAHGFDPVTALIPGPDRAHYLPTHRPILLKLVADRKSRRVLGLQGVGPGEVAKRIDIVATAITAGLDLHALSQLDLCYAPPYSLALDSVLTAANVVLNKLDGLFDGIGAPALRALLEGEHAPLILDVRLPAEYSTVRLPGSQHIPLGALRGRLHEVPQDRPIVIVGKIGLRSYEAALILRHHGFTQVRVLDGGLDAWPYPLEQL